MTRYSFRLIAVVLFLVSFSAPRLSAQGLMYNPANGSVADLIIEEATKYIGTPYRWGGKTPGGFDCAGFTRYVYGKFGVALAPSAAPQFKAGISVKKSELRKGDLVFFGGRKSSRSIGHVGIVTSVDENGFHFIHASTHKGITISYSKESYYSARYICACRVIDRVVSNLPASDHVDTYDPNQPVTIYVGTDADTATAPAAVEVDTLLTIAMVGDMMLGTTYPSSRLPENDGKNLFDDVRSLLFGANIAVGNCHGPICENGKCTIMSSKNNYAFRMPPSYANLFKEAGFDFLSLANNHSNDFSTEGIRETMRMLDSMDIKYAGIKGLCRSAIIERDGVKYGFCSFGHNAYTYRHQDESAAMDILHGLRDSCDILIVSFQGGAEGQDYAHLPAGRETYNGEDRGALRQFAHLCIDEGADVVFGFGPHVCRAMEVYKGRFIAYSLGNFCTTTGFNVNGISGYAPVVVIRVDSKGKLVDGKVHSFIQSYRVGPRKDNSNQVAKFMRSLTLSDIKTPHMKISDDGSFVPVD